MSYITETLRYLRKKYNLKRKERITLEDLDKISKNEKIAIEELLLLFQISRTSFRGLKGYKQKSVFAKTFELKSERNKNIINAIKNKKINLEQVNKLNEELGKKYVQRSLCITAYQTQSLINGKREKIRVFNRRIKTRVTLLQIHLKGIPGYYKKNELYEKCKVYGITLNQYLYYSSRTEKYYKFQKNILKKNEKGLWIGKTFGLSNEFLENNFKEVHNKCKKVAINMAMYYGEKGMIETFTEVAFDKIMESRRNN